MQEPQRYTQIRRCIVAVQPLDGGAGLINHLQCCTVEQVMIKMRTVPEQTAIEILPTLVYNGMTFSKTQLTS